MARLTGQRPRTARGRVALAFAAILLVGAIAAGVVGATRAPCLDPSYGKGGVVEVKAPFGLKKESEIGISGFGAAGDGAVYAVGSVYPCLSSRCKDGEFLMHFSADGKPDRRFGDEGAVFLHGQSDDGAVIADGAARALVFEDGKEALILRRFRADGDPDRAFGTAGVAEVPCRCAEAGTSLVKLSRGHLMVIVERPVRNKKQGYGSVATRVHLIELLPDGSRDRHFGHSGTVDFKIPRPGGIGAVARTAGDALIFGGANWESAPRRAWLWRVGANGRVDGRFDRNATRSLSRLGRLGEFPGLNSIVPGSDGTIAAVGTIHEHLGFVLRLRQDGKLDTGFGKRGLTLLPANLESAVAGIHGAVFAVGEAKRSYYYSAYRVLADGRPDPAFHGRRGIKVPLPGEGIEVQSQGGGRALVTNIGYYECREGCPSEPGMARFLE